MSAPSGRKPADNRLTRIAREYVGDVRTRDLQRLFGKDAGEAFRVLTRDRKPHPAPRSRMAELARNTKLLFLGMSAKLTPARRVLFAAAIVLALLGLVGMNATVDSRGITIDFSPLYFLASIGTLVFLLALELVDRITVRDELEVARQLQAGLLPRAAPELPGYRFAHSYRMANEVGGDYYDFRPLPDGRVALVIADASGHGMAAGLLMAIANAVLRLAIDIDPEPVRVAEMLNRVLLRTGDRRSFMTLFYALLQPSSGDLRFVCAGHPFPFVRRGATGEVCELGCGSLPLGLREQLPMSAENVMLGAGDTLVLYSDGLPEAINAAGEAFGYERAKTLTAAGGGPAAVHDRLTSALQRHLGEESLRDDVSLAVIHREG